MNLSLVLAIALGAISGVVEAPVMRPVPLVAQREIRAKRQIQLRTPLVGHQSSAPLWASLPGPAACGLRPAGVSRPRAPALG